MGRSRRRFVALPQAPTAQALVSFPPSLSRWRELWPASGWQRHGDLESSPCQRSSSIGAKGRRSCTACDGKTTVRQMTRCVHCTPFAALPLNCIAACVRGGAVHEHGRAPSRRLCARGALEYVGGAHELFRVHIESPCLCCAVSGDTSSHEPPPLLCAVRIPSCSSTPCPASPAVGAKQQLGLVPACLGRTLGKEPHRRPLLQVPKVSSPAPPPPPARPPPPAAARGWPAQAPPVTAWMWSLCAGAPSCSA